MTADPNSDAYHPIYDAQNPDTRGKKYAAGTVGDGFEEGVGWMEGSG